jgi:hypothetical protein
LGFLASNMGCRNVGGILGTLGCCLDRHGLSHIPGPVHPPICRHTPPHAAVFLNLYYSLKQI